ncbi:M48 family metalloprotease [Salicola sp. Rm-C-2C1-2]|uniref:M48 family metalloprotease n=1 Tax=Salicola sp. Rm-C-2C1-2 TaxID=3141321 RepID=UPI0032E3C010
MRRAIALFLILCLITLPAIPASENRLPAIGSGGLIAGQQERAIGQQVLTQLRRNAPLVSDPMLREYFEDTLHRMIPHAPLQDREITPLIINEPSLNAFAVPGNIIGIHTGLLRTAETEHEFAGVVAHEIAHLSQRHYARRLEQQERSTPLTIAGILAGLILTAATGSEAGIAAIAGTQAMAIDQMLRHSRAHEQEADRLGIEIMARAGYDPAGMPAMFERMLSQARLQGNRPPEYLSTHPLTESRVADTRARVSDFRTQESYDQRLAYHLVRNRVRLHHGEKPEAFISRFRDERDKRSGLAADAAQHGLAAALIATDRAEEAIPHLRTLLERYEGDIFLVAELARALRGNDEAGDAAALLERHLDRHPRNLTLSRTLADIRMELNQPDAAARLYEKLTRDYPGDATLWNDLSEAAGRAGHLVEVHHARGERLLLLGDAEAAARQFRQALERAPANHTRKALLRDRLEAANERASTNRQR